MSTTRRSTANVRPLVVAATASLVALIILCVFVANVVKTTSETNARISERVSTGEVRSTGHVLVNATSAPDGSAAPVTTTTSTTTTTTTTTSDTSAPATTSATDTTTTSAPALDRNGKPCPAGWHLAEDRTCVNPGYYNPTTTEPTTTTTSPTTGETSTRRAAPITPAAPVCQEDETCWNSCTMGNFGPCDMGATLPNGGQFAVTITPNVTMVCDQVNGVRYVAVDVTVSVVSPDRVTRHDGVTRTACVLAQAPFAGGSPVELAPMFREVAAQL